MKQLDLKKRLKHLYQPRKNRVEILDVPRLQFAMLDGAIEKGYEPGNSPGFSSAIQALYGISYTLKLKFKKRKSNPLDYPVMALEGLWWVEDGVFDIDTKDNLIYTLMILQPEVVTADLFAEAVDEIRRKKGDSPVLSKLRLAHFQEGLCVQALHIGPYDTEPATVERMHAYTEANGYRDCVETGGRHHEIYLGNPSRAAPEKLRTVLRHPIEKI